MELPRTRAVAARLERPAHTGSTNADLRAAAERDPAGWPHLSVVLTDDQRAGRGRLDRPWVAPAGAALAISVLLDIARIPPASRGWIPLAAGLAMAEAIGAQLPDRVVGVKWPNDVLVTGADGVARKICGILAEALPGERVVVGAGVNTAMTAAQRPVDTATSFAIEGGEADVDLLVATFARGLDEAVARLAAGDAGLPEAIAARCVTLGQAVAVSLPAGGALTGDAVGLAPDGRLVVRAGAEEHVVGAGDIVHLRPA